MRSNSLRHCLTYISTFPWLISHLLFSGKLPSLEQLRLDDIFRQQDKQYPIPGSFLSTPVMSYMILADTCSPFGLVNAAIHAVLDPMVSLHVCQY